MRDAFVQSRRMNHILLAPLAAASRDWVGGPPNGAMLAATRAFLAGAEQNPRLIDELASAIPTCESSGSSAWLALTSGTAVESGVRPEATGLAVIELMRLWLPHLPVCVDVEEPPEPTDEQSVLLALMPFVGQSVVTHLARMPALRGELGADAQLLARVERLRAFSHGAVWIHEALTKSSGRLILLHPESRTGVKLRYMNVSNAFHLFSLIQTAVGTALPGGREPSDAIARVARGKSTETVNDEAWWHYSHPRARQPDLATMIGGERLVRELPEIEGHRVMLAWSTLLKSRGWDTGFLQPHLAAMPADAVLDGVLTATECETWFDRIGHGARQSIWRKLMRRSGNP